MVSKVTVYVCDHYAPCVCVCVLTASNVQMAEMYYHANFCKISQMFAKI